VPDWQTAHLSPLHLTRRWLARQLGCASAAITGCQDTRGGSGVPLRRSCAVRDAEPARLGRAMRLGHAELGVTHRPPKESGDRADSRGLQYARTHPTDTANIRLALSKSVAAKASGRTDGSDVPSRRTIASSSHLRRRNAAGTSYSPRRHTAALVDSGTVHRMRRCIGRSSWFCVMHSGNETQRGLWLVLRRSHWLAAWGMHDA
jgi:hypothetical protein